MAIAIKSIPTLENKVAESFIKSVEANNKKKASVDFTDNVKSTDKILKKAKLK